MKKYLIILIKWGIAFSFALSIFGCGSADKNTCPYAYHIVKATVTNAEQEPLPGIKVLIRGNCWRVDSAFTDNEGNISLVHRGFPRTSYTIEFNCADKNYQNKAVEISFKDAIYSGGNSIDWYEGIAGKEINAVMEKKSHPVKLIANIQDINQ